MIWNRLGIGKRQNDSIMHQFKFPSYTITNLRTLDKQEVWQSVASPSAELSLQQKVNKRKWVSHYLFEWGDKLEVQDNILLYHEVAPGRQYQVCLRRFLWCGRCGKLSSENWMQCMSQPWLSLLDTADFIKKMSQITLGLYGKVCMGFFYCLLFVLDTELEPWRQCLCFR